MLFVLQAALSWSDAGEGERCQTLVEIEAVVVSSTKGQSPVQALSRTKQDLNRGISGARVGGTEGTGKT